MKNNRQRVGRKEKPRLKWSVHQASIEFDVARETIRRGLRALSSEPGRDGCFTTRQIFTAIAGDLEAERIRDTRASADLKEMDRKERAGELVEMAEVERLYTEALLPIRQRLTALPSECATRCNPTDPEFARRALSQHIDEILPMIREKLPKAKA